MLNIKSHYVPISCRQAVIIFDNPAVNKQNVPTSPLVRGTRKEKKKKKENQHKVPASTTIYCIIDQGAGLPGNNAG